MNEYMYDDMERELEYEARARSEWHEEFKHLAYRGKKRKFFRRPTPNKPAIGRNRAMHMNTIKIYKAFFENIYGAAATVKNENGTFTHTFKPKARRQNEIHIRSNLSRG